MTENVKIAEKASKLNSGGGGMLVCLKVLYQTLILLHKFEYEYDWLLNDLYTIFIDIAEQHKDDVLEEDCGNCLEIKSRLYCRYAIYLGKKVENLEKCFSYFMKSLNICRSETWTGTDLSESYDKRTLHEFVVSQLGKVLIAYSRTFASVDPRLGVNMAQKAIVAIAEVKNLEFQFLLCEALLVKVRFLVDLGEHQEAMTNISMVETRLTPDWGLDYARLSAKLFLLKGEYFKIHGEPTKALLKFKQALLISRKYGLRSNEGLILLQLGKLYLEYPEGRVRAREALEEAKTVFIELMDKHNRVLVMYLLAKLDVMQNFPRLMQILKRSNNFCDLQTLRQWKYLCKPFWRLPQRSTGFTLPTESLTQLQETGSLTEVDYNDINIDDNFSLEEAESIFAPTAYTEDELRLTGPSRIFRISTKPRNKYDCLMEG